jgi:hypothetical protein
MPAAVTQSQYVTDATVNQEEFETVGQDLRCGERENEKKLLEQESRSEVCKECVP